MHKYTICMYTKHIIDVKQRDTNNLWKPQFLSSFNMGNIIYVECNENNVTYLNALYKEKLVDTKGGNENP